MSESVDRGYIRASADGTNRHSIGEHRFYIQLVEHAHRVIPAIGARGFGFIAAKHCTMRFDQVRRSGANADRIGLRFERFDRKSIVFVVGLFAAERRANRMGVIIDGLDACDPGSKLRIDATAFRCGRTRRDYEKQDRIDPGIHQKDSNMRCSRETV